MTKKNYAIYFLITLLTVASFALGSLYTRVKDLEKKGDSPKEIQPQSEPTPKYLNFNDALKDYAKQTGIDGEKLLSCTLSGEKKTIVDSQVKEGGDLGVQGTPAFFINGRFLGGAFPYESFKEIIDKELAGQGSGNYKDYSENLQRAYEEGRSFDPKPKKVEAAGAAVRGTDSAKVTIVEFSDFQCPFCAKSYSTVKKILEDYKGSVRLIYKHFPLNAIHKNAQKAAEAVECAKDQGKFWELHDKLLENQSDWANI